MFQVTFPHCKISYIILMLFPAVFFYSLFNPHPRIFTSFLPYPSPPSSASSVCSSLTFPSFHSSKPSGLWSPPPPGTPLSILPPTALCLLTWQNDIWETQFARECQGPVEHSLVLPSDLLQLTPQQLQGNYEAWGGKGGGQICVCKWGERANKEVWGCGRKVELKERKRKDEEEGRWEKGGTEGYLKDISQNVGEEKTDRRVEGET